MEWNKKKLIVLLSTLSIVAILVLGFTYAYFAWTGDESTIDVAVSSGTGSCSLISDNNVSLVPTNAKENGRIIRLNANQQMSEYGKVSWKLQINSLNDLKDSTFKYELINTKTDTIYGSGNFGEKNVNETIDFINNEVLNYNEDNEFILYLWIDGEEGDNPISMSGQEFDFDMSCTIEQAEAPSYTPYTDFTYELSEDTILLQKYNGESPTVDIASTYEIDNKKYNVIVGTQAFYNNEIITDVVLEKGINYQNNDMNMAFAYCTNLVSVTGIPEGVTNMSYTFEGCTNLVNAPVIPASVTNMSYTFEGCTNLVNAPVIPVSVTTMANTFSGCRRLETAPEIPGSVTDMQGTFNGCTNLANAPVIPESVTNMANTFAYCASLETAPEIPGSVTNMYGTFQHCTSLETAPEIPGSVTDMSYTFSGCRRLETAPEIPGSVTDMFGTFYGCTSLANAPVIPESVTNMQVTFQGCTSLTGTIRINSTEVSVASSVLGGTELSITVEVPANSTTYEKFKGTNTDYPNYEANLPSNVTLKIF